LLPVTGLPRFNYQCFLDGIYNLEDHRSWVKDHGIPHVARSFGASQGVLPPFSNMARRQWNALQFPADLFQVSDVFWPLE